MRIEKGWSQENIIMIVERKKLIENLRSKQLLRASSAEKNVRVVENFLDYTVSTQSIEQNVGSSVLNREILLKHKSHDNWNIRCLVNNQKSSTRELLDEIPLSLLCGESKSRVPAFILRDKKGGYKIYCHGILGFLPSSQFKNFLLRLYKRFRNKGTLFDSHKSKITSYVAFFLSVSHQLRKYGFFRIPLYAAGGIIFKPSYFPKQFSKSNYIKKFRGSLSPVFIYRLKEKKSSSSARRF